MGVRVSCRSAKVQLIISGLMVDCGDPTKVGGILRIAEFLPIKICAALEHRIEVWKINSIEEAD